MASSARSSKPPTSITPQRKHRKLLKDGSGTEVWPEAIEKVFVQGLREYWESPYATYSQSRGRSRWRNQFLVDYLHKQGIDRSKKQVASHIQVLRNMWKGEPEFHLVAGGDELYPDNDSSPGPVKLEDNSLIPFDWEESDQTHSNPVSPDFSPADSQSEFPPTPEHRPNLFPSDFGPVHHKLHGMPLDLSYSAPGISSPSISPDGSYIQQLPAAFHDPSQFAMHPKYSTTASAPVSPVGPHIPGQYSNQHRKPDLLPTTSAAAVNRHHSTTPTHQQAPRSAQRNKITSIFLHADGMTPFSVKVDALAYPTAQNLQPPYTLRVRLCVPMINDARTPPTLHGFLGGIALESVWSSTGRCITKVYENSICVGEETGFLNVTHINVGTVNAVLPESPLSRCRWMNAGSTVTLTQEIVVDDETLLFVIYDLDRRNGGSMPSATLLGYQKYRAADKGTPLPASNTGAVSPSPSTSLPSPHAAPYARSSMLQLQQQQQQLQQHHHHQPSLSYALSPMRYASPSGLNF